MKKYILFAMLLLSLCFAVTPAQTQASMTSESCDEYRKADGEMNAVYQQVLRDKRDDARFLSRFRTAQRRWIGYRDAQLAAIFPAANPQHEYGSVYHMCRCIALADETRRRTEELRHWIVGVAEGDVCAGSVPMASDERASDGGSHQEQEDSVFSKRWTLTQMGDRSISTAAPYLEFDVKQRRFSGFSGCNNVVGGYNLEGTNLKFTAVAATQRACIETEAQQLEASFLKALGTTRLEIEGDTIRLYARDSPILTFRAASKDVSDAKTASVTGTLTYRQRIALSPNAVIEVRLLDVSRADAPAETIAEQMIRPAGRQVPIEFELSYDPQRIVQRNRYTVQVRILEGGKLRFITTESYPVITGGNPSSVDVIVNAVR